MQTECLVLGNTDTRCTVRVRFLRMVARSIEKVLTPLSELSAITAENIQRVEKLDVEGNLFQPWQEAVEEQIEVTEFKLSDLANQSMPWPFRFSATQDREAIRNARGLIVGIVQRPKKSVAGMIELATQEVAPGLAKLSVRISNDSRIEDIGLITREEALTRSLVSAHTILEVRDGEFVSMVDPPESYREAARSCQNFGTWPVLVGEEGQHDTLLSSPIILYDYPQIAPESPGDLFDGAEIDEILMLRIMTLTDEEKREMRQSDERARKILERTESLPDEQLMKLHGALRGLRSSKEEMP
jgi:hypothetical protein